MQRLRSRTFRAPPAETHGSSPAWRAVIARGTPEPALSAATARCHNDRMTELTDYIASLDEPARSVVDGWRLRGMELVPTAEEGESYGMAALRYRGRPLVSVVRTKAGYTIFPLKSVYEAASAEDRAG